MFYRCRERFAARGLTVEAGSLWEVLSRRVDGTGSPGEFAEMRDLETGERIVVPESALERRFTSVRDEL